MFLDNSRFKSSLGCLVFYLSFKGLGKHAGYLWGQDSCSDNFQTNYWIQQQRKQKEMKRIWGSTEFCGGPVRIVHHRSKKTISKCVRKIGCKSQGSNSAPWSPWYSCTYSQGEPEHFLFALHIYILTFPLIYMHFTPMSFGRVFYHHSRRNKWLIRHLCLRLPYLTKGSAGQLPCGLITQGEGNIAAPNLALGWHFSLSCTLVLIVQAEGVISSYVPCTLAAWIVICSPRVKISSESPLFKMKTQGILL